MAQKAGLKYGMTSEEAEAASANAESWASVSWANGILVKGSNLMLKIISSMKLEKFSPERCAFCLGLIIIFDDFYGLKLPPFTKRPKCKAKVAGLMAQRDAVAAGKGWWRLENCHGNGEPFSDPRKKSIVC